MDLYLIYTKLPEALQAWLSKLVYKPKIGKHCILRGKIFFRRQVDIGEYTVINTHAYLANIKIGKYCSVGKDFRTIIISHRIDLFTTQAIGCIYKKKYKKINSEYSPYLEGEIVIGNDVWIGENVTIIAPWGGKLVIGDGAVIGAGSIVTKDIPPYAVCVGSPAKINRYRFNEEKIQTLLKEQWWNWSEDNIFARYQREYEEVCNESQSIRNHPNL